ncbi:hypothetical protein [Amphiplicatus metriothermophilus]|nr:hypothetical protein [Amphiplicatus metriothermophilus]MBB5518275.1 hypothetical protein [Amphiplicatus metriothermophilus]
MTRFSLVALAPLALAAIALWLAPWALPLSFALDMHQMALAYGGVGAAFLAGADAGGRRGAIRYLIAALAVWIALWPGGAFHLALGAAWRYLIIIGVLIYLWLGGGARAAWKTRLVYWAVILLALIMSRLLLLGYY